MVGEVEEDGEKVQTSSYTVSPVDVMYILWSTADNTALLICKLLREAVFKEKIC